MCVGLKCSRVMCVWDNAFFLFCLVRVVHIFDFMLLQTKLKTNGNQKKERRYLIDSRVFDRSVCHYRLECLGTALVVQVKCILETVHILCCKRGLEWQTYRVLGHPASIDCVATTRFLFSFLCVLAVPFPSWSSAFKIAAALSASTLMPSSKEHGVTP